ncbi:MAG: hypothetical protein AAGU75_05360 [Bacillota bacterium]
MKFLLGTKDLLLKSSDVNLTESLLEYYLRNKAFLEEFEPKRDPSFFTYEGQYNQLEKEVVDADQKVSFHFYIFNSTFAPWLCEQSLDITGQTTDPIV